MLDIFLFFFSQDDFGENSSENRKISKVFVVISVLSAKKHTRNSICKKKIELFSFRSIESVLLNGKN